MTPPLKYCRCGCGREWRDYPGGFAQKTRPQYPGDPTNGCPGCGGLYWAEADDEAACRELVARIEAIRTTSDRALAEHAEYLGDG